MPIHYIPKKISQLDKADTNVAIIGKVIEDKESSFILEDESGKVEINKPNDANFDVGSLVRVFCTIIGAQLKADVVQSLKGLDIEQFKKIEELYNKAGI